MRNFLIILICSCFISCNNFVDLKKVPDISKIPVFSGDDVNEPVIADEGAGRKTVFELINPSMVSIVQAISDIMDETGKVTPRSVTAKIDFKTLIKDEVAEQEKLGSLKINTLFVAFKVNAGLDKVDMQNLTFNAGASVDCEVQADIEFSSLNTGEWVDGSKDFLVNGGYLKAKALLKIDVLTGSVNLGELLIPMVKESFVNEKIFEYMTKTFNSKVKLSLEANVRMGAAVRWKDKNDSKIYGTRYTVAMDVAPIRDKDIDFINLTSKTIDLVIEDKPDKIDKISDLVANVLYGKMPKVAGEDGFFCFDYKIYNNKDNEVKFQDKFVNLNIFKK